MNPGRMAGGSFGWMLLAAWTAFAFSANVQAEMYKCVDERGITHYSEKLLPNCRGGAVDIKPIPPVGGKIQPRTENLKREERDFQKRRQQRAKTEEKERKALEQRCRKVRGELQRLQARRVYVLNDKGERVLMDDAAREQQLAHLKGELRACS